MPRLTIITPRTYKTLVPMRTINGQAYSDDGATLHLSSWIDDKRYDLEFESTDDIDAMIKSLIELRSNSFKHFKP